MNRPFVLILSIASGVRGLVFDANRRSPAMRYRLKSTELFARPDSSEAIVEALRISEEHGSTSAEARVAWETVEEMDASDLSPAYASENSEMVVNGAFGPTPAEVREMDYAHQVSSLAFLLRDTAGKLDQIKTLVASLKALELDDPALARWRTSGGDIKVALRESKAAVDLYGPGSPEADEAWSRVEECAVAANDNDDGGCTVDTHYRYSAAAIKAHHLYDAVIDASLLQAALDGIQTLESLRRSIQIENQRLQKV